MTIRKKISIGAVVVLYNPTENEIATINTYKNLVNQTIVIDNSDDSHYEKVNELVGLNSSVLYYSEGRNLGLCKALNMGVKQLEKKGCQWVLIFDADSKMESNIVDVYRSVLSDDSNINRMNTDNIAILAPVHIFERSRKKPYQGYREIEWAMTSGCLFNSEIFNKEKGFMEALFVDGLDIDYCFRIQESGYKVVECGEAVINHHPAETGRFLWVKYGIASPERYYMQARSLVWCWKRYNKPKMLAFYMYKWFKVFLFFPNKKIYINKMIEGTRAAYDLLEAYQKNGL